MAPRELPPAWRAWRGGPGRRWGLAVGGAVLAVGLAVLASGCSTVAYLGQSVGGHLSLMAAARPVPEVLADARSDDTLKAQLALSQRLRDFAVSALQLPDNGSYRRYAALDRPAAVWNVAATSELSLKLHTWCFPVTGCIGYRGYYALADAEAEAAGLRAQGLEVTVYPVPAYSTLGKLEWLGGDPLLSTFIRWPEHELARLIFHELAHQVAYAQDDTAFNESFATAVEQLGISAWIDHRQEAGLAARFAQSQARRAAFTALTRGARARLQVLYASGLPAERLREAKAAEFARLQADYRVLRDGPWAGFAGYDAYFARVNNATLALQGAYLDQVDRFIACHRELGGDWSAFYDRVRQLARLPASARQAGLAACGHGPADPHAGA
ncbi:aminopeptidase [Ideonella livida]|uniref:Aminopeptidase n=1 Tax=Ideonella livida TaxID=2707176 RepID=A0A7C9TK07_9BURK|nr:aminopeptidase [Ideonella livida]NDY92381.1 aminopeptidase [Ideonella livida]